VNRSSTLRSTCEAVCAAVADIGFHAGWHVKLRATELLLEQLVDANVHVMVVRAVAYGRSATHRLGGALIPESDAELEQFREQVGPAMLTLGHDVAHAVLVIDRTLIIELASWLDHDDPGVMLQPFVAWLPADSQKRIVVEGLTYGVSVVYQPVPTAALEPLNRTYEQIARQLAWNAAPRVRWSLDSPQARKQASA
jgi:hypothetical protein